MKYFLALNDFNPNVKTEDYIWNGIMLFITLFSIEFLVFLMLTFIKNPSWEKIKPRHFISRLVIDLICMSFFSYSGLYYLYVQNFRLLFPKDEVNMLELVTAHERSYYFSYINQRLCFVQIVYEIKSIIDALIHKDPIVSIIHHIATTLGMVRQYLLRSYLSIFLRESLTCSMPSDFLYEAIFSFVFLLLWWYI
jgi:hypothetical protein